MITKDSSTSFRQFSIFRFIFGCYLTWHFAYLLPYAGELFSCDGILGAPGLNPYHGHWPNPFFKWGSPRVIQTSIALGVLASGLLAWGKAPRSCALVLWLLLSCLFTANPLTANPSLGYVGLLLLLCAIVPRKSTYLPSMILITAWVLLALGYSFSGILKLSSPSWIDGTAMHHLMTNPLARPGMVRDLMLWLPTDFLKIMTWSTLLLEILFVPLALFRRTRPYIWLALLLMHLGIMLTVDFADLSLGMVMIHLFTFQRNWLPARASIGGQNHILFLDADCLFCQRSAQLMHSIDSQRVLDFSSLQGKTATMLPDAFRITSATPPTSTSKIPAAAMLVEHPGTSQECQHRGADAILRSLYLSGGPLSLLWIFHYLPSILTNFIYQFIATHRFNLPFIKQSCPLPSVSMKQHYLP